MEIISSSSSTGREDLPVAEIVRIRDECLQKLRQDHLYQVRNSAKLRAVTTTSTYEEFKDIVDSAHLTPLSRADKQKFNTKATLWNPTNHR